MAKGDVEWDKHRAMMREWKSAPLSGLEIRERTLECWRAVKWYVRSLVCFLTQRGRP